MDRATQHRLRNTIKKLVGMLVVGDYEGLETLSGGVRLRSEEIEAGVVEYPATLVFPPDEAYEDIYVVEIDNASPPEYATHFRLFTNEEGRSDLELQATLVDDTPNSDEMRVIIDDLLVP
jgi:hypothetical protein